MARRETKKEETGKMSREEAGEKGGEATKRTHDREFYQEIGKKGGEERAREIREEGISPETHEKLSEAGRKGGEARAREIREEGISPETHEKLSEAGRKGGEATRETHGREFYQEIGKKGGAAPKEGAARRGGAPEKGEVIVRRSGKDIDIIFSSQEEAEEWRNRFAPMMEEKGYHFTREKPETAEAAEAAA